MEQTAAKEYTKNILNLITDAMDNDLSLQWLKDKIEVETSLEYVEKEKKQIIDAYSKGCYSETGGYDDIEAEQYYNETFKQD